MKALYRRIGMASRFARLGAGPVDRVVLFIWSLYVYIQYHVPIPIFTVHQNIRIFATVFRVELKTLSDLWVVKDVLLDREYECVDVVSPTTIIDIGCNIGISSLFFAAKYPNARIYAIEPNTYLSAQLRYNVGSIEAIEVHTFALAAADGPLQLAVGKNSASGSLVALHKGDETITVPGVAADSMLLTLKITKADIVKFDIEGAEEYLFRSFTGFNNVGAYIGEMHYDLTSLTPLDVHAAFSAYSVAEYPIRENRSIVYAVKT